MPGERPMSNTFTWGLKEFLSPMFNIIVVWDLIQPEAEFMFVKDREREGGGRPKI